jgi:hypothetical protein
MTSRSTELGNTSDHTLHSVVSQTEDRKRTFIHRGKPGRWIERLKTIADKPARMIPFGHKPERHNISCETEQMLADYLARNGLEDVYVCVNEYDPAGEWRRLKANQRISPGWRYTFGVMNLIGYTLVPDPVFCANRYNVFTHRLSLNLDEPLEILFEAACAKDAASQSYPGMYVAITSLPVLSLIPKMRAMNNVVAYSQNAGDWETERAVYRRLYPRIGMESSAVAVIVMPVWWEGALLGICGSAAGHLAGRYVEMQRERERTTANECLDDDATFPSPETNTDSIDSESELSQLTPVDECRSASGH